MRYDGEYSNLYRSGVTNVIIPIAVEIITPQNTIKRNAARRCLLFHLDASFFGLSFSFSSFSGKGSNKGVVNYRSSYTFIGEIEKNLLPLLSKDGVTGEIVGDNFELKIAELVLE